VAVEDECKTERASRVFQDGLRLKTREKLPPTLFRGGSAALAVIKKKNWRLREEGSGPIPRKISKGGKKGIPASRERTSSYRKGRRKVNRLLKDPPQVEKRELCKIVRARKAKGKKSQEHRK